MSSPPESSRPPSSSLVKRTISTVRSLSPTSRASQDAAITGSPPPSTGHRRIFSLSRKARQEAPSHSEPAAPRDDAHSDSPPRSSVAAYNLGGSMRLGTQTLIQALQALPWDEHDDGDAQTYSSDEEDSTHAANPNLASSIHAIHLPVARSRHNTILPDILEPPHSVGEPEPEASVATELDTAGPDFEPPSSTPASEEQDPLADLNADAHSTAKSEPVAPKQRRTSIPRTQSMTTIRQNRRARLAEKLAEVFDLKSISEVVAEIPCWLLRSVLLQGYMYLTNTHICFFAHMPSREDQVLKSGTLNKKAQRTKRWNKHWFVLKDDVLSWYHSSSDPYFPHGVLDLRYAISCETQGEKGLRLRTTQKTVELAADSVPSRDEWVKAIRKVIFKAQNMGESVKIAIPYMAILDVDKSSAMDFSETIEVKVVDKDNHSGYSIDSYFFAYFKSTEHALVQMRDAVQIYRQAATEDADDVVKDTTAARSPTHQQLQFINVEHAHSAPDPGDAKPSVIKTLLRPFSTTDATFPSIPSLLKSRSGNESGTGNIVAPSHVHDDASSSSSTLQHQRPAAGPAGARALEDQNLGTIIDAPLLQSPAPSLSSHSDSEHTYPPSSRRSGNFAADIPAPASTASGWNFPPVPRWLPNPSRLFSRGNGGGNGGVIEVVSHPRPANVSHDSSLEFGFSILENHDAGHDVVDPLVADKFRAYFALDDQESLLGYFPGSLFRVLPSYGRVYVSTNNFCFRSSSPLTRTRMMIPIRDILSIEKTKPYRLGQYGLVVVIRGYEELFFEFSGADKRNACVDLLESQMEVVRGRTGDAVPVTTREAREALFLEDLESTTALVEHETDPRPPPEGESVPAVMFTSTNSTFLTFKPQESLRFTFLTIGSRGDVQPYIALGKGLVADGHRVKIATHGEFKDWIESHGLEFGYVGGDPAELMRICVDNGTFTVGFLREGVTMFRGWIDDLLNTSWEACQNTDVLVESPSAMAGIHIAEALRIPYFRAFTMPWSRTRAYPHAFAVPEHKMGGSYNYMTYVMFDQVFWRGTASQINRWRRRTLGLPSTTLDKIEQHKVPFLYNFSPAVVPQPLDWYEWIRVTGYWFLDDADVSAKKWEAPPDLVEFIDNAHNAGKKVVYVGFGSIVVPDPTALTRTVVEAIEKSGVHAILSKGWSDRLSNRKAPAHTEPEVRLPPQIFPIASVPHDWLFARIDAACHHGGAGTTGASLRAGIPTIIKPFFGDQFFWADRVEALGIGSAVRKMTVDSLATALHAATTDEKQIGRAALVGQQIRAENGVATAIEAIYRDLEYARTLVKHRHKDDTDEDNATVQERRYSMPAERSPHLEPYTDSSHESSNGSAAGGGAPSEDWSVISSSGADDDRRNAI
ncbi:UDP-Glycosyltransferase/glycogen phosphorylase [Exidia glandulosa HHB12029]|uniref:Sterol 3-beta-glucosyltransferase n=1 Tax=Exidia glandulosa HHB12029 TaxID=1314781 RepID=A0A165HKR5_EXIGL|nr:UDP-Glycosyltransferase/glycogen phosphorylase [Exidia glandulosa HHB12029]